MLLKDIQLAVKKLTPSPQPKNILKNNFKPNWQTPKQKIPFTKDSLLTAGYIAVPKQSTPPLLVIDFDLDNMTPEQKQEALSVLEQLLPTTPHAKTTKGYHLYFLLPEDPSSPYNKTQLNTRQGVDIPLGVFLPHSDTTKTLHNENKPLTTPPKLLTDYLFAKQSKQSKQSKQNKQTEQQLDTIERHYINYAYIKPLLEYILEHNYTPHHILAEPHLLKLFEEILFAYNSAIKPHSLLAQHFDEQNIPYNIVKKGHKNEQLNRFAFLLLKDPSVTKETFTLLTELYNLYLDREEQDKDEHKSIIRSLLANHDFNYDPNIQKTLTKAITVTHEITNIKFYLVGTPEGKYMLLPYLPHHSPDTTQFTKQMMQQHLIRDFSIPKQQAKALLERSPIVSLIQDPLLSYGLIPKHINLNSPTDKFNTAVQTHSWIAFHEKAPYDQRFVNGYLTLINNVAGNDPFLVDYLLAYFKTRYQHPKLRPIIFIFWGIGGSGKDTVINLLSAPFGTPTTITENIALDKHSTWPSESNVHISEIADWSKQAQNQLKAQLKTITGSQGEVTLRPMRSTTIKVKTHIQLFISMNTATAIHSTPNELRRYIILKSHTTLDRALQEAQDKGLDLPPLDELVNPENYHHFHAWLSHYQPQNPHNFYSATETQNSRAFKDYLNLTTTTRDKIVHLLNSEPTTNYIRLQTIETICSEVWDTNFKDWLQEQPHGSYIVAPHNKELYLGRAIANKLLYRENAVAFLSEDTKTFNGNKTPYITIIGDISSLFVKQIDTKEEIKSIEEQLKQLPNVEII